MFDDMVLNFIVAYMGALCLIVFAVMLFCWWYGGRKQ
jgi:hypothetical protein